VGVRGHTEARAKHSGPYAVPERMRPIEASVRRHPAVFSLLVVIGFLALLLLPDLLIKEKSDAAIESVGIVERMVISALAIAVLSMLGWTSDAGVRKPGSGRAWAMVLPPLVYLAIVFPYLFTRSWRRTCAIHV
jgi:hypothetical protein